MVAGGATTRLLHLTRRVQAIPGRQARRALHAPAKLLTHPVHHSAPPLTLLQATRMFVSNLNQKMSQRFLVLVLLPHVRADIRKNRRLHFALFQVRVGSRERQVVVSWRRRWSCCRVAR